MKKRLVKNDFIMYNVIVDWQNGLVAQLVRAHA